MARKFFCMLVKNNEELIGKAHELLVLKMYSANVSEALNAIEVSAIEMVSKLLPIINKFRFVLIKNSYYKSV